MKIRNQMKKWIALLCVLAMVFSYVPSAFADGETEGSESTPVADSTPAQDAAPAPAAAAPDPAPAANTAPAQDAAPTSNTAPAQDAAPAPAADPAPSAPTQEAASNSVAEPIQVSTVEEYQSLDPLPTEPGVTRTEETVETKTVTNETTTPVSETVEVEQKTDTVTNEDGSTTITTETTTTTTTESETTTKQETTTTTTETYEVKSEGSYVTDSEEVAAYIAAQEEEKQEEIKADVEEKGGSYDYLIKVEEDHTVIGKTDEQIYNTDAEAAARVEELSQNEKNQDIKITSVNTEIDDSLLNQLVEGAISSVTDTDPEKLELKVETGEESSSVEVTFSSAADANAFITALSKSAEDNDINVVNYNVADVTKLGPISESDTEEKGYYVELAVYDNEGNPVVDYPGYGANLHYQLTIHVTGGVEEITLHIPDGRDLYIPKDDDDYWWWSYVGFEPGDTATYTVKIVNDTNDEYEIGEYEKTLDGPVKKMLSSKYDESYGNIVAISGNYTFYEPSSFDSARKTSNGKDAVLRSLKPYLWYAGVTTQPEYVSKYTYDERKELEDKFDNLDPAERDQNLLNYYNYMTYGEENPENGYTDVYEAWGDNLRTNLWEQTYNGVNSEKYFAGVKGKTLNEMTLQDKTWILNGRLHLDGENTCNMYQNTLWEFGETLVLRAVHAYKASAELVDEDYKVSYNEVMDTYEVKIDGLGTYKVKEEKIDTDTSKMKVVEVKTETVVEKETVPPTPDQPVVPVIPNIPFFPAEIGNNPQGDLLEIDDFMTPLAGSLIMNEGDCIN